MEPGDAGRTGRGVIYDCFTFFNELDLLDIRLHELASTVDVFVLAEAPLTFQGQPKPLVFQEHRNRYRTYLDKIRHVVVTTCRRVSSRTNGRASISSATP